jgi:predicted nucleic acid-binding protein
MFNEVLLPGAVIEELLRINALKQEVAEFLSQPWVKKQQIQISDKYNELRKSLDAGESEAIILAQQRGAGMLLMDESKGRRLAMEMNLKVLGLMGLLIRAKKEGLIAAVKPDLDTLVFVHGFWLGRDLYQNILKAAGE